MTKTKTPRFNVRYKGRFEVERRNISSDIAFKLLKKCMNKSHSFGVKTKLNLHDSGFHIGNVNRLAEVHKTWYMYDLIYNYFIFENDHNTMVICAEEKSKFYFFLLKFEKLADLERLELKIRGPPPENGVNNDGFDREIEEITSNSNFKTEISMENDDEANVDYEVNEFIGLDQVDTVPQKIEPVFREYQAPPRESSMSYMDNFQHSPYDDLFNNNTFFRSNSNEPYDEEKTKEKMKTNVTLCNGSTYLFSHTTLVPVIDLYGSCESDEDI